MNQIIFGDCTKELNRFDSQTFDALVTDPPYGLVPPSKFDEAMIADCLAHWLRGQRYKTSTRGYRKNHWDNMVPSPTTWTEVKRVMKDGAYGLVFAGARTLDLMTMSLRLAGFEIRDTIMWLYSSGTPKSQSVERYVNNIDPNEAHRFAGIGTGLKPAFEPIILIRKPSPLTLGENALKNGPVGLHVDQARIGDELRFNEGASPKQMRHSPKNEEGRWCVGRWPSNVILDGEVGSGLEADFQASRYFYVAKATRGEREDTGDHPTVKPLALMSYLVRMTSAMGSAVLDPFCGSGTTGVACKMLGRQFVGIDSNKHYCKISAHRITNSSTPPSRSKPRTPRKSAPSQLDIF